MTEEQPVIHIRQDHWDQMRSDVAARVPDEACGIVAGIDHQSTMIIPVTNILHDSHHFRMAPDEQLKALLLIEEKGWDMLAIYHSHPLGIDHPSATDIKQLTYPGIVYLIWFQVDLTWQCKAYLMQSKLEHFQIPLIISTKSEL